MIRDANAHGLTNAPHSRSSSGSLDVVRIRMIRETELALHVGLTHPTAGVRIPAKEVGTESFSPDFAEQFWRDALGLEGDKIPSLLRRLFRRTSRRC